MRATAQAIEGNRVKLSVELDEREVDQAVDAAFRKLSREVRVPGFRPGKVPRRLLEARVGAGVVRQEALRDSLPGFYVQAVRDTELDVIADPEIDITAGEEAGPVSFDATVEVRPTPSIVGYQGLAVTVPSPVVQDSDVDAQVDRLRDQQAVLATASRPGRDGDHLTIDIKAYRHDQVIDGLTSDDFVYELGSGTIVTELDDALRGARPGDILRFNAATGEVAPEGSADISFQVLVKEVKEKVLPEATDEWVAEASEYETLEELRADLRDRLVSYKRTATQLAVQDRAVEALVALVDTEPPAPLVQAEIERRVHDLGHRLESRGTNLAEYLAASGRTQEDVVAELRAAASVAVQADLALRVLADAEDITVSDAELDREVAALAHRLGQEPAALRRQLEADGRMAALRAEARKAAALSWLTDHVELVDEEGRPVERAQLVEPPAEPDQEGGPAAESQTGAGSPAEGLTAAPPPAAQAPPPGPSPAPPGDAPSTDRTSTSTSTSVESPA